MPEFFDGVEYDPLLHDEGPVLQGTQIPIAEVLAGIAESALSLPDESPLDVEQIRTALRFAAALVEQAGSRAGNLSDAAKTAAATAELAIGRLQDAQSVVDTAVEFVLVDIDDQEDFDRVFDALVGAVDEYLDKHGAAS